MSTPSTNARTEPDNIPRDMAEFEEFAAELEDTPDEEQIDEPAEPTEPATEDVQAEAADAEPTAEPESDPAPEVAAEPEAEDQQTTSGDPLDAVSFAFGGKTQSLRQWLESGDFDKVVTNANQSAHFQQKYREKLEAEKAAEEAAKAQQAAAAQASPEAVKAEAETLRTQFAPKLLEMAKAGAFESDMVEDYPVFTSRVARHILETTQMAAKVEQRLRELEGRHQQELQRIQAEDDQRHVMNLVRDVAESGEAYAGLKDDSHLTEFFTWLADDSNPWGRVFQEVPTTDIQPEHLTGLYGEFLVRTGKQPTAAKPPKATPAAAAGASTGGGRPAPTDPDEYDAFAQEMIRNRLA